VRVTFSPMRHVILLLTLASSAFAQVGSGDWPMLGHDASRSGATPAELCPPFERKWYRLFTDEGLMSGLQPVVAEGTVFTGNRDGQLYALDAATGKTKWTASTGGSLLNSQMPKFAALLDLPWCRADEFCMQKLSLLLDLDVAPE